MPKIKKFTLNTDLKVNVEAKLYCEGIEGFKKKTDEEKLSILKSMLEEYRTRIEQLAYIRKKVGSKERMLGIKAQKLQDMAQERNFEGFINEFLEKP